MSRPRSPHCIDCGAAVQYARPFGKPRANCERCKTCSAPSARWQLDAPERRGQPWPGATAGNPMADLLTAARGGDAHAAYRCDALYGDSWRRNVVQEAEAV